MSNLYDVVGYAHSGYATCPEHTPEDEQDSPIFEGSETDSDILCDVCYGIAFADSKLRGQELREACLIVGKNIWYASELKELAETFLRERIEKNVFATPKRHCEQYALSLLETCENMTAWYAKMKELEDMDIPALFPEIVEKYQYIYWHINEDVQDYLQGKTGHVQ